MTEATQTIVERLLEPKASLFYTDSTMRTVEVQRPLQIEREAAAEIERLQARVAEEIASLESAIADVERLQAQLRDYKEWHADHKRLVRELDVAINGEDRAAPQASLCDVLAQIRVDWPRLQSELNTALERVKVLEGGITKLITTSQMLLQNAEGCAVNRLVDCENDIVSARAVLQSSGGK